MTFEDTILTICYCRVLITFVLVFTITLTLYLLTPQLFIYYRSFCRAIHNQYMVPWAILQNNDLVKFEMGNFLALIRRTLCSLHNGVLISVLPQKMK